MTEQLPHVAYLLAVKSFMLDPSVYHYTKRELVEVEASIGDIAGDIAMGQAAIAYHKNILSDSKVADTNIKQQDIYQAESESIKAKAKYKALILHLTDLTKAKHVMQTVLEQCEVLGVFSNEAVTQMYEMVMFNKANDIETMEFKELPFFDESVMPRDNHITRIAIEKLLSSTAAIEVQSIEHK